MGESCQPGSSSVASQLDLARLPQSFRDIRACVFDVDGTLTDHQSVIAPDTIEALRFVADAGLPIVLATGRVLYGGTAILDRAGIPGWVVAANGGIVWDGHDVSRIHPMGDDLLSEVERAASTTGLAIIYYSPDGMAIRGEYDVDLINRANEGEPVLALSQLSRERVVKVSLHGPSDLVSAEIGRLKELFPQAVRSHVHFVDISDPDVDKWTGVSDALRALTIDGRDVLGCGDSDNDVAWMSNIGFPIAVPAATAAVRQCSRWVLPDDPLPVASLLAAVIRCRAE